jgi:hypothetical protein
MEAHKEKTYVMLPSIVPPTICLDWKIGFADMMEALPVLNWCNPTPVFGSQILYKIYQYTKSL